MPIFVDGALLLGRHFPIVFSYKSSRETRLWLKRNSRNFMVLLHLGQLNGSYPNADRIHERH